MERTVTVGHTENYIDITHLPQLNFLLFSEFSSPCDMFRLPGWPYSGNKQFMQNTCDDLSTSSSIKRNYISF